MRSPVDVSSVVYDTFTDSNSTAIDAHTPDITYSGGWTQTASTSFYVQSNAIQPNRNTNGDLAFIETGLADFTLTATITPYNSGANRADPGILFRYTDANNYWYAYPESDGPVVVINKVVSGSTTTMMIMKDFELSSGKAFDIRIDCVGKNIILYLRGKEIVTVTDSFNQTATKHGIFYRKSNSPVGLPSWDNFKVTKFTGFNIAWPDFTNYDDTTPLVALGVSGFDSIDINDPSVQWDSANSRWAMAYTGNDGTSVQDLGMAYATSLTGPWTKDTGHNPVLNSAGGDQFGMNGGLVKLNSTWYYYYGASTGTTIKCATSPDLITWTDQGTVLQGVGGNAWDSTSVFDAFARVREDGKTIELWYCGKNGSSISGVGYALSTNGTTFTRTLTKPIFSILPFSSGNFGEPSVYVPTGYEGKQMLISMQGSKFNVGTTRFIVQALTLNGGQTWHYRVNALVGSGSNWASVQVFDPHVLVDSNTMYLFVAGSNTTGNVLGISCQIGVARASFPTGKFEAQ